MHPDLIQFDAELKAIADEAFCLLNLVKNVRAARGDDALTKTQLTVLRSYCRFSSYDGLSFCVSVEEASAAWESYINSTDEEANPKPM